ncbi:MAG: response regulator [Bacillus sp. (in: firmicutes)]
MGKIKVLLIEDDPMVREVNRQFIERVDGFSVIGYAGNGVEGIKQIEALQPDLVFMDIFMPEQDGLLTLQKMREKQMTADVITVTAANDTKTVQRVMQFGVFDYIMKPFLFERIKHALENYMTYRNNIIEKKEMTQDELDQLLLYKQTPKENMCVELLPKGLNATTLEKIMSYIQVQADPVSAEEVANGVGLARVTARRYLDYLQKQNKVKIIIEYGSIGRPINQYIAIN